MTEQFEISRESQALMACASDDGKRFNLNGVYYNCKHAVATDGHKMVVRQKEENEPANTLVRFKSGKQKGKLPGGIFVPATGNTVINPLTTETAEVSSEVDYPDYKQIMPRDPGSVRITINAEYLMQIAQALSAYGKSDRANHVTLQFNPDNLGPIVVSGCDSKAFGIVMPVRPDEKAVSPFDRMQFIMNR